MNHWVQSSSAKIIRFMICTILSSNSFTLASSVWRGRIVPAVPIVRANKMGIAAGAVKHQDLFLENPVKLPFLSDVPLPLVAFVILAPIVFIVSHTYTLVHFVILAGKVGVFNKELRNQLGNGTEIMECLRWQLPANIFVQILAGPARLRKGRLGILS